MKDNIQLKKFDTETVNGTFNIKSEKNYFCSVLMEIEDSITIDNTSVQYYQFKNTQNSEDSIHGKGYQSFDKKTDTEFNLLELYKLKNDNHTISLLNQTESDMNYNTKWKITMNVKNILSEYLFAKIKEQRIFKCMRKDDFINKNINKSIYEYISNNILDRYEVDRIDMYIKYYDINVDDKYNSETVKKYNPLYKLEIYEESNIVKNINIERKSVTDSLSDVYVNYSQTKPSTDYVFYYYFNIIYKKI